MKEKVRVNVVRRKWLNVKLALKKNVKHTKEVIFKIRNKEKQTTMNVL